jgi:anaerobic selenocysteine-containing dehydrogenase
MVSIDIYRNETSRHADLILPTTFGLEHSQFSILNQALAVRNVAHYSPALLAKPPGLRHDWEVLVELAARVGREKGGVEAAKGWLRGALGRGLGARRVLDLLLRIGPHRLSLRRLERTPHGVDLGPLEPRLAKLMGSRKLRVAPERFVADLARLERRLAGPSAELVLVSRRTLRSNNSWNHNAPRLVSGKERCVLEMHPLDAGRRGIESGQRVALKSRVGQIVVPVSVTDAVMPGVVSLPHGWGHDKAGAQLSVAATRPGASVNDVTDDAFVDALSGAASLNGVPVQVEGLEAAPA